MEQDTPFVSESVTSFLMSQQATSPVFGSSSFSTPTHSSIFGSNNSHSMTIENHSPFAGASPSPTASASSSFHSKNASSSWSPSPSSIQRAKQYKSREVEKETPASMLKNRRDAMVSKFRKIDLKESNNPNDTDEDDDFQYPEVPHDPTWTWDSLEAAPPVPFENEASNEDKAPWYVFDDSVTLAQYVEVAKRDRNSGGNSRLAKESNYEMEDEMIEDKEVDPWSVKTEIFILPLINIEDPVRMLCGYCKQYSLEKSGITTLTCTTCTFKHNIRPDVTITMLKERTLEAFNQHKAICPANFTSYTISNNDIILICDSCDRHYNIFMDYTLRAY